MWDAILRWVSDRALELFGAVDAMVPAPPPELAGACGTLAAALDWLSPVTGFLPFGQLAVALVILAAGVAAGVAILLTRIAASFATLGGGGV